VGTGPRPVKTGLPVLHSPHTNHVGLDIQTVRYDSREWPNYPSVSRSHAVFVARLYVHSVLDSHSLLFSCATSAHADRAGYARALLSAGQRPRARGAGRTEERGAALGRRRARAHDRARAPSRHRRARRPRARRHGRLGVPCGGGAHARRGALRLHELRGRRQAASQTRRAHAHAGRRCATFVSSAARAARRLDRPRTCEARRSRCASRASRGAVPAPGDANALSPCGIVASSRPRPARSRPRCSCRGTRSASRAWRGAAQLQCRGRAAVRRRGRVVAPDHARDAAVDLTAEPAGDEGGAEVIRAHDPVIVCGRADGDDAPRSAPPAHRRNRAHASVNERDLPAERTCYLYSALLSNKLGCPDIVQCLEIAHTVHEPSNFPYPCD
jgi:hypothetical protein